MLGRNIGNNTPTVTFAGGMKNKKKDIGLAQCLESLSESCERKKMHYIKDMATILGSRNLSEGYMSVLLEDYENDIENMPESQRTTLNEGHMDAFQALVSNSADELLNEAFSSSLAPVVGLTFPLMKINWMKNIYKDIIPTVTSSQPVFNLSLEKRYVRYQKADNTWERKYLPEAYDDPNFSLEDFSRVRILENVDIPINTEYQMITQAGNMTEDRISTDMHIETIKWTADDIERNLRITPDQRNGSFYYDRIVNGIRVGYLVGSIDFATGKVSFGYVSTAATAKESAAYDPTGCKINIYARLSAENHVRTPEAGWEHQPKQFVIPDGMHVATGVTKETLKDEKALFNTDGVTRVLEIMQDIIGQEKDRNIQKTLDRSAASIAGHPEFITATFDCKVPSQNTAVTPSEWVEKEIKIAVNKLSLQLNEILREDQITTVIVGNPRDIFLLDNEMTMVQGDASEIGGCKRSYRFGIYNKMRNAIVVSSERAVSGKIAMYVFPNTDDKMTYKLFNYQFFITNEYRQTSNLRIPSVAVSDRYLIDEFTPMQGELVITNNSISASELLNRR